jgi:formate hydrogenlyase subunit 4
MQGRIGPPLRQPFRDVAKLFAKENIVPDQAITWVFNLIPLVGLISTLSILVFLPLGGFPALLASGGDLIVVLYLLIVPSLCLVIGGFSSGSPYAIVGAQREMATMIAYEFPLAILLITIAWNLLQQGLPLVFSFSTIASAPVWNQVAGPLGFIGFVILLGVLLLVTPAELTKIPFDASEAETEIAGGLLVEYSGRNLAMFYLTDAVKTVVMASLIVALFFPYNLSPFLGLGPSEGMVVDVVFYLVKVLLVLLFSVTLIRVAIARLKIDQIVYTYWVPLTLASLVGLILVMWDNVIMSFFATA